MLLSGFLILFFGFFILFGYLGLRNFRRMQRNGIRTTATTVGVEKQVGHDSDGKTVSYHLILEFKTSDGETYTVKTNSNKRKKGALRMEQENALVPIIYDASKPTDFMVDSRMNEIFPMILLAVGTIGVLIGLLGLAGVIDMPRGEGDYWGP